MAVDTSKIQNANLSIEEKKVLLELAAVVNAGLAPMEAAVAALEATVDTAATGLVDRVAALEGTIDTAVTGLSAVAADHEDRIVVLEMA